MASRNQLLAAPPYDVERTLKILGANLKTARIRRSLTHMDVARKIGTSRFVVAHAESGKPSTGVAVYAAMLWAFGMIDQLAAVAAPDLDREGLALEMARSPKRVRPKAMSNDF